MKIEDWFDTSDKEHIDAYIYLNENGIWPEGFIPDYVELSKLWAITLLSKFADMYLDQFKNS